MASELLKREEVPVEQSEACICYGVHRFFHPYQGV
mgnify:CR=1 FL=1